MSFPREFQILDHPEVRLLPRRLVDAVVVTKDDADAAPLTVCLRHCQPGLVRCEGVTVASHIPIVSTHTPDLNRCVRKQCSYISSLLNIHGETHFKP